MSGTLKIAGTTLATNPTNSKVEIDDAVNGKGICKAWVNFNGTLSMTVGSSYGPNVGNVNPIRAAHNVDYIIDRGAGDYEVHYENAMADENYVTLGTTGYIANSVAAGYLAANRIGGSGNFSAPTVSSVRVNSVTHAGSVVDTPYIYVAIFR